MVGEDEKTVLEKFGYKQELRRSFGLLGVIGFSFSVVSCWSALGGVLIIGVQCGGPSVMIYSWIGVCLFSLAVAYSMAEMCSAYPLAGGQYTWVAHVAPPRIARGLSWVTGWFMLTGILAMGAANIFVAANFVLGMANLSHPGYVIQRWHTVLVAYLISLFAMVVNLFGSRLLDRLAHFFLPWNIVSFLVVIIAVLATNDHKQPASFVFSSFENFTGFGNGFAVVLGLLQSAFGERLSLKVGSWYPVDIVNFSIGMICYDAPAHMTEETLVASKDAPKAIVASVYIGGLTGFIFLIAVSFCIGDITATAKSATGVPLLQIFYDSTGSVVASCFLMSLILVIGTGAAVGLTAEGGRTIYAFARDHGLPFSGTLSKVEPRRRVPVNAILLGTAVQMAMLAIYFGSLTGFNTIVSIATEGYYLSYAMPLLARILAIITGTPRSFEGPFSLGSYSIVNNIIGLLFLLFIAVTTNFPASNPVDKDNMNYTSAAIGVIGLISIVTWLTTGQQNFTDPQNRLSKDLRASYIGQEGISTEES